MEGDGGEQAPQRRDRPVALAQELHPEHPPPRPRRGPARTPASARSRTRRNPPQHQGAARRCTRSPAPGGPPAHPRPAPPSRWRLHCPHHSTQAAAAAASSAARSAVSAARPPRPAHNHEHRQQHQHRHPPAPTPTTASPHRHGAPAPARHGRAPAEQAAAPCATPDHKSRSRVVRGRRPGPLQPPGQATWTPDPQPVPRPAGSARQRGTPHRLSQLPRVRIRAPGRPHRPTLLVEHHQLFAAVRDGVASLAPAHPAHRLRSHRHPVRPHLRRGPARILPAAPSTPHALRRAQPQRPCPEIASVVRHGRSNPWVARVHTSPAPVHAVSVVCWGSEQLAVMADSVRESL